MSTLRLLSAAALLVVAASANASSFYVTTDSLVRTLKATSDLTTDASGSLRDNKIVRAARDDAASFVASEGAIRGIPQFARQPPCGIFRSHCRRNRRAGRRVCGHRLP